MRTYLYTGHDYFNMDDLLTEEHKLIRDAAREWVKKEVSPIIEDAAENQVFPQHLLPGLGAIGAFGPYIPEQYGGAGLDQISYGLIMQELERCDSGLRSTASVQSSLVMYPIWKYGSEEQKMKYLPKLGTGEWIGCFGLTEPDHGSNPGGMTTSYVEDGDDVDAWRSVLKKLPKIATLVSKKLHQGEHVLIQCLSGTRASVAAVLGFMLTKRGLRDDPNRALPFFRLEETIELLVERIPNWGPGRTFLQGFHKLQDGLDEKRTKQAWKRMDNLYRAM